MGGAGRVSIAQVTEKIDLPLAVGKECGRDRGNNPRNDVCRLPGAAEFGSAEIRCSPFHKIFVEAKRTDQVNAKAETLFASSIYSLYIAALRRTQGDSRLPFLCRRCRCIEAPKPVNSNACERSETKLESILASPFEDVIGLFPSYRESKSISHHGSAMVADQKVDR